MDALDSFLGLSRQLLPQLTLVALVVGALAAINYLLERRFGKYPQARFRIQILLLFLTLIGILGLVLFWTRNDPEMRGQLLSFLGILLSAAIALSSTTFLGNALAGILLRVVAGFQIGDFISVGEDFGRVSERSILHTEIQTEDRDLTTLPNLYLVTHPVRVVRASGTMVAATVSLGYDVPHAKVQEALIDAAERVGLEEAFVHVLELGDFSVNYRVSGLLTDVKSLLSTRSSLRAAMLDALHERSIEIVSPSFMNTRSLETGQKVIPPSAPAGQATTAVEPGKAETVVFDKAEEATQVSDLIDRRQKLQEEIDQLRKEPDASAEDPRRDRSERRIEMLEAALQEIEGAIQSAEAKIESD